MRFVALDQSPPGFFVDEAAAAMNALCFLEEGHDYGGTPVKLFADALGYGYSTPALLYFADPWIRVFGTSVASMRSIAAFFSVLTIAGIAALAGRSLGRGAGILVFAAGALSPWSFVFSRILWDPPLMPCFLIWGTYFFLFSNSVRYAILSGACLSAALYSYPPARAQIPVLFPMLVFVRMRLLPLSTRFFFSFALSGLLFSLPLVIGTITGDLQQRFRFLSITSPEYLAKIGEAPGWLTYLKLFSVNLLQYFDPRFLLLRGDTNFRHSTGFGGHISWLDLFAILVALGLGARYWLQRTKTEPVLHRAPNRLRSLTRRGRSRPPGTMEPEATPEADHWRLFLWLALWGMLSGLVPAALTWEGNPHALRSIGTWPFLALFTGLILQRASALSRVVLPAATIFACSFAALFLHNYFYVYPAAAGIWFDENIKTLALAAKRDGNLSALAKAQDGYHEVGIRNALVEYFGDGCSSSRDRLAELRRSLPREEAGGR